ncbi:MAG: D-aminoacyl-tRNA deacylase [Candidatus Eisenbacteria bacterium]
MRALVQRVAHASVTVEGRVTGTIGRGLLVFLGVTHGDQDEDAVRLAEKCVRLRCFPDGERAMNLALGDVGGALLAVSQFTLYGDTARGHRPSFAAAAGPAEAEERYRVFCAAVRGLGVACEEGVFRAHMEVALLNEGPVTLLLEAGPSGAAPRAEAAAGSGAGSGR